MHLVSCVHRNLPRERHPRGADVTVHPIEEESYGIMRSEVDLSRWNDTDRAIVERIIHSSADLDYANMTVVGRNAGSAGLRALQGGAPIVVDANMVMMGITTRPSHCYLDDIAKPSPDPIKTRSALAVRRGIELHPDGAIFVIGNAPTALFELLAQVEAGTVRPAMVIGLPVGFVGAAESKEALRQSSVSDIAVSNIGRKGGSAVAAGAINALIRVLTAD
jgi:precorrin-8X/cobalt-precorrin-8 methylmutase